MARLPSPTLRLLLAIGLLRVNLFLAITQPRSHSHSQLPAPAPAPRTILRFPAPSSADPRLTPAHFLSSLFLLRIFLRLNEETRNSPWPLHTTYPPNAARRMCTSEMNQLCQVWRRCCLHVGEQSGARPGCKVLARAIYLAINFVHPFTQPPFIPYYG